MGHPTHAIGFRLAVHRCWSARLCFDTPLQSVWRPWAHARWLLPVLKSSRWGGTASTFRFRRRPWGTVLSTCSVQPTLLFRLQRWLFRRTRRRRRPPLHPLRWAPTLPPPLVPPAALAPCWFPYVRWRTLLAWSTLLSFRWGAAVRLLPLRAPLMASLLSRYFLGRVRLGLSVGRVVNSFLARHFDRLSKKGVVGILVRAAGRFTRSQMASSWLFRRGRVPLGTLAMAIEQGGTAQPFKYGICSLTVWVARRPRFRLRRFL